MAFFLIICNFMVHKVKTDRMKAWLQKALALDVPRRVPLTVSNMRHHCRGDTDETHGYDSQSASQKPRILCNKEVSGEVQPHNQEPKTKSAVKQKHALITEKSAEYFTERKEITKPSDYLSTSLMPLNHLGEQH